MLRKLSFFIAGYSLFFVASASAQDPLLSQLYGSGVHAFFGGNYTQAVNDLTAAIDGGSKDPRTYYFRGLCDLRTGKSDAANSDFQKGAELEGADVNQAYPVSKSLERIQGTARAMLEKYRLQARVASHQRKEDKKQMVYQQRREADNMVLRQAMPTPNAAALQGAGATGPADAGDNPFGEAPKMTTRETVPADTGAPAIAAPEADPFGNAATPPAATPSQEPPAGDAFNNTPPPTTTSTPPPSTTAPATTPPPSTAPPASTLPPSGGTPPPGNEADPFAEPPPK